MLVSEVCNLGRAEAALLGVVAINDGPAAEVHATKAELMAGTPGTLAGDWGAREATATSPWGGTADPMLVALTLGIFRGAGLAMISTWLPGPKPWGGTTKRALLRKICVPAARGVEVLMTILCWIVPVAEVANGALLVVAEELSFWFLPRAS